MKDFKNDSTLARFGRDKRARISTKTTEHVEHRPYVQREAADTEFKPRTKRASYNPHFTEDNRPNFEKPQRNGGDRPRYEGQGERRYGEKRYGGDRPRFEKGSGPRYGAKRSYQEEGERPNYGERNRSERPYGGRPQGEKRYGDRPQGEKRYGERPAYGEKRTYGDRKFGPKRNFRSDDKPKSYPKYDPNKQIGEMRLNRYIAQSGLCSRREADDFISAGLVSVNGVIVSELGSKVMPGDVVKFNDSKIEGEKKVYLVLNKPKGFVTSLEDPHADKTVMDLVKGACTERIYPVGRLDKNSLGLLLFTNDGDMTKQLTHPAYKKKKIYQVTLDKPLTRADMDQIAQGVTLDDGEIHADEIAYVKENKKEVGIEIHSGRNRVVRRIFEALGYTVQKLDRVYYAGLTKKNLKRGQWRFLTHEEVDRLKSGRYE